MTDLKVEAQVLVLMQTPPTPLTEPANPFVLPKGVVTWPDGVILRIWLLA